MQVIDSKSAQNNFGNLMNKAMKSPVIISKYGKPSTVVMSHEEFLHLEMLEDLLLVIQAKEAEKEGFLSASESSEFLSNTNSHY